VITKLQNSRAQIVNIVRTKLQYSWAQFSNSRAQVSNSSAQIATLVRTS